MRCFRIPTMAGNPLYRHFFRVLAIGSVPSVLEPSDDARKRFVSRPMKFRVKPSQRRFKYLEAVYFPLT